jgi:UrcA family protein
MRKFIMSLTTVASLSLAAVPILGLTQAANAAEPTAIVKVSDLNLASPKDADKFRARVETAGRELCATQDYRNMSRSFCLTQVRFEVDRQLSKHQRKSLQIAARAAKSTELAAQ